MLTQPMWKEGFLEQTPFPPSTYYDDEYQSIASEEMHESLARYTHILELDPWHMI